MREAKELHAATLMYHAQPLEDNLFEWHFTVQGPKDTAFEGGRYHGRIILPPDYPMKPPSIIMLTVSHVNGCLMVNMLLFIVLMSLHDYLIQCCIKYVVLRTYIHNVILVVFCWACVVIIILLFCVAGCETEDLVGGRK